MCFWIWTVPLFGTYGKQEGEGFNFHYQAHGYHPLLCYDGLTGNLIKAELRDGTLHSTFSGRQEVVQLAFVEEVPCPSVSPSVPEISFDAVVKVS